MKIQRGNPALGGFEVKNVSCKCDMWNTGFCKALIKLLYIAFINLFIKLLHVTCCILTSISHENTIEIPFNSKKHRQAKLCLVVAWIQMLLFTGETSFSSGFFFDTPKISAQNQKLIKYYSMKFSDMFKFPRHKYSGYTLS